MKRDAIRARFVPALVATLVLSAGCSNTPTTSGAVDSPGTVTVVATDLAFQPKELHLSANQPQTVRLENRGRVPHDWTVEQVPVTGVIESGSASHDVPRTSGGMMGGAGGMVGSGGDSAAAGSVALHVAADAGHTATIEFTPTRPGTYVFYCSVPGHRQAGMEGTLVVQ